MCVCVNLCHMHLYFGRLDGGLEERWHGVRIGAGCMMYGVWVYGWTGQRECRLATTLTMTLTGNDPNRNPNPNPNPNPNLLPPILTGGIGQPQTRRGDAHPYYCGTVLHHHLTHQPTHHNSHTSTQTRKHARITHTRTHIHTHTHTATPRGSGPCLTNSSSDI